MRTAWLAFALAALAVCALLAGCAPAAMGPVAEQAPPLPTSVEMLRPETTPTLISEALAGTADAVQQEQTGNILPAAPEEAPGLQGLPGPTREQDLEEVPGATRPGAQPTSAQTVFPAAPPTPFPASTKAAGEDDRNGRKVGLEPRAVELEWPAEMRLGESDIVRMALVPYEGIYIVQAEFPEHQVQSQPVQVQRAAGYSLAVSARLDGVGFEISPVNERQFHLAEGEPVSWRWALTPRSAGRQRLVATLTLFWVPDPGGGLAARAVPLYSRGLDVRVRSFLGMNRVQTVAGGFFGLLLGSSLSLFALTYRVRTTYSRLRTVIPNTALIVETRPGIEPGRETLLLLQARFRSYARLVVEREFLSGYSGARTFLAIPIKRDGRADAATIVKVGPRRSIQREFENYETYVKDSLPPITARIQHPPVSIRSGSRAALQYTFIAEPGRLPIPLRQALLEDPSPDLLYKLFDTFGPNWWMQRNPYVFRLGEEYDRLLPPHYVLKPCTGSGKGAGLLHERLTPADFRPAVGETVLVQRFSEFEEREDGQSLTLFGCKAPGQPALRIRWLSPTPPARTPARVSVQREGLLGALTAGFYLHGLAHPIPRLASLLEESVIGTRSIIHGDLNLENILVGPGNFVWLIDFAQTRMGHPLFDFARLASEVIAQVEARQGGTAADYLARFRAGIPLLQALEEIGGRCLFNPSNRREYHLALAFACIGAVKFSNLDDRQKQFLFLTGAELMNRL